MYGNPAFAPAYGPSGVAHHAMAPYHSRGMVGFGVDPPAGETTTQMLQRKLDEPTLGVKNKFWLGGALVGATLWYGVSAGWFR